MLSRFNRSVLNTTKFMKPAQRAFATNAEEVTLGVPTHMSNSEAFVEQMVAHGVTDTFGIVGSAFMDALDLWPGAGIRFISVAHE
jgi:hypothetical protein